MGKTQALKVVNALLALSLAMQAFTGIFRHQVHELFETVHGPNGLLLTALAVAHLAMNWRWVVNSYAKRRAKAA